MDSAKQDEIRAVKLRSILLAKLYTDLHSNSLTRERPMGHICPMFFFPAFATLI